MDSSAHIPCTLRHFASFLELVQRIQVNLRKSIVSCYALIACLQMLAKTLNSPIYLYSLPLICFSITGICQSSIAFLNSQSATGFL